MTGQGLARRHALLLAMSGLVYGAGLRPALAQSQSSVVCPTGAWNLTRRLTRGLRDGKSIVVTRRWRVAFTPLSRGISVSGQQTSVKVDAPPVLAQLSKIEEARSTEDMFPILLAPDGIIMAAGEGANRKSLATAVEAAESLLVERGVAQEGVKDAAEFFAGLQQAGSSLLNNMPGDLFYPSTQPVRHVRQVPLADGVMGEFELSWQARAASASGLLESAQRSVTTRVGDSALASKEEWRLTSA